MAQQGFVFRKGPSWFLKYRDFVDVDGRRVRKLKCVKLADYCDRYRCESNLEDLVAEKMASVRQAAKCPRSSDSFISYVEGVYLPFVQRGKEDSTYAGYLAYWNRYIRPRVGKYALRDFTVAIVSSLLEDAANTNTLNTDTVGKIRSVLSAIFTYAMGKGDFPGRSAVDNPASRALIPESATEPKETIAASVEEAKAILAALSGDPLARAALALAAFTGIRPGEVLGVRWEEWSREEEQLHIVRAVWRGIVKTTKTGTERYVAVAPELRSILLDLWNAQGCPIAGFIIDRPHSGRRTELLKNLFKRNIKPVLKAKGVRWPRGGFYSLRRFLGTEVRKESGSSDTASKALGNTKEVLDKHYLKSDGVLPDVREAVKAISRKLA